MPTVDRRFVQVLFQILQGEWQWRQDTLLSHARPVGIEDGAAEPETGRKHRQLQHHWRLQETLSTYVRERYLDI